MAAPEDAGRRAAGPTRRSRRLSIGAVLAETRSALVTVVRNADLRRVQLALVTSLVGDFACATAVTVWAYTVGGASAVALLTAARLAAAAVTAPLAAVVSDRVSRRTALLVTSGLRALLIGAAAAYLVTGADDPWPVYVLATLAGVFAAPFRSAQRAWMPALADDPRELAAANAASGTLESLAVFVGPALGGLLLLVASVPVVLALNVATFALSMLLIARVRRGGRRADDPDGPDGPGGAPSPGSGFLRELSAGFVTVGQDPDLRNVAGQVCAQTFVGGASKVFLVVLAVEVLGTDAGGVGLLEAVLGVGAVVGGLLTLARASRQRLGGDLAAGVLLWSLPLLAVAAWPSPVVLVVALVVVGAANPVVDVNLDTIVQRMTPEATMARVFGALDTCYIATQALGSLVMAPLLVLVGVRWSLVVVAVPVAAVAALSLPRMRRLDARLEAPAALPLVQQVPWFRLLTPAVQESLARSLRRVEAGPGATLVREGDPADAFFVIASGRVEVTQEGRVLRQQGPGDFFGEIALVRDIPRTASVVALEPTVVMSLGRHEFLAAVAGRPRSLVEEVAASRLAFRG
ncbi:MFS family permease [Nocardioides zeae]|uniref:MFS family permease n=1 Tax=Nocardioides zeae TaxID=1457234 RepID=A0ACC6IJW2_9ACTN|nr:cyclic nucleotide-binding domain-containing protein [Nocardioides zeae]MDR6211055.1 MFS family permease [Nocardioides zeae]